MWPLAYSPDCLHFTWVIVIIAVWIFRLLSSGTESNDERRARLDRTRKSYRPPPPPPSSEEELDVEPGWDQGDGPTKPAPRSPRKRDDDWD